MRPVASARMGCVSFGRNENNSRTRCSFAVHPSGTRPSGKLGYLPGLDGLRAIAVIAVLAYHFRPDHSLLPGGFLGVEVFFVISGYLITALLLEERRSTRRTALGKFWMRRIRRLFAALYATLVIVGLLVAVFHKNEDLARLRGPLFAGATYVSNWQQWFGHVEHTCMKSRAPLYGNRSACDINREHVNLVMRVRSAKYAPFFQPVRPRIESGAGSEPVEAGCAYAVAAIIRAVTVETQGMSLFIGGIIMAHPFDAGGIS